MTGVTCFFFFFFFITLGLELSDTKVYEPKPSLELLRITAEQLFSNRELGVALPWHGP